MKIPVFSKDALIRHEDELKTQFRAFVLEDRQLRWRIEPGAGPKRPDRLELEFDGHRLLFHAAYELKPSRARLAILKMTHPMPLLLVTPELSQRLVDHCRDQGVAAMDLNGRAWLRGPGLMVDRGPLPGRSFRYTLEPRDIFVGKSARILRCLLTDRDRTWTQAEVLSRTRASGGLVSRIVTHLISQGYLEKMGARQFRLGDPADLVDAWVVGDRQDRVSSPSRYSCADAGPSEVAARLHAFYARRPDTAGSTGQAVLVRSAIEAVQPSLVPFKGACPAILFTQWTAASLRRPGAPPPPVTSAYVSYLPTQGQMEALGLRPATDGGNVWLFLPRDEGIFLESRTAEDLPLTTDAQICLDLLRAGHTGAAEAAALREWEGFCRV